MKHIAIFSGRGGGMQVLRVRERSCAMVAACILGTKKRKVKKELLHTPLLEIPVFYFSVGYKGFFAS